MFCMALGSRRWACWSKEVINYEIIENNCTVTGRFARAVQRSFCALNSFFELFKRQHREVYGAKGFIKSSLKLALEPDG